MSRQEPQPTRPRTPAGRSGVMAPGRREGGVDGSARRGDTRSVARSSGRGRAGQREGASREDCALAADSLLDLVSSTAEQFEEAASLTSDRAARDVSEQGRRLRDSVSGMRDRVGARLADGAEDVSAVVDDIAETTEKVIEEGQEMEAKIGAMADSSQKDEMREKARMMIMVAGGLFLMHFGVSPEMIGMAGMAFKLLTDKNEKPLVSRVTDLAKGALRNNSKVAGLQQKAFKKLESYTPGLARLGIDPAAATEALTSAQGPEDLLQKARAFAARLPSPSDAPEIIKERIQSELEARISSHLGDRSSPDFKDMLFSKLDSTLKERGNPILTSIIGAQDSASLGVMDKAKSLAQMSKSINDSIDKFCIASQAGVNQTQKLEIQRLQVAMKEYVRERYEKPVRSFCESAERRGTGALAAGLGISADRLERLNSELARSNADARRGL